ncbi:hypothetical protein [Burkholderia aenigmatica]|uniref:hypothetical protein n=2 Tax=Burkholderiaceae TaxID=119060 RepID=UPI001583F465|nr:hypothetical protein [Burkholderia aenigmatica]
MVLESRTLLWGARQMADARAFVIVERQGEPVIERGLVRRENSSAFKAAGATVTGIAAAEGPDKQC